MSNEQKNYFKNLKSVIKKFNIDFLVTIPNIFKIDSRIDKIKKKNFYIPIFRNNIFIQYPEKYKSSEIFFVSHYLGNVDNVDHDFYYYDIFKKLEEEGKKFSVILLNKTNQSPKDIIKKFQKSKISRVIINNYYSLLKSPLVLVVLFLKYIQFKIRYLSINLTKEEKKIQLNFSLKNFIKTRNTYILTKNIKKITNTKFIKGFFTTYEGHSFEKNLIQYFNRKNIKTFGYYFSIIRDLDTNVFYDFELDTMPNNIYFTGQNTKKIFLEKANFNPSKSKLDVIGYTRPIKYLKKENYNKILLFCPEGLYNETELMLKFAKKILNFYHNIKIIFRLHPEINKNLINFNFNDLVSDRFILSYNKLEDDLNLSSLLIYRGSSVCINALYNDVLPIYLKLDENINLDPLFKVNKNIIHQPHDLDSYIKNLKKVDQLKDSISDLKIYADEYFEKFNYSKFKNIVFNE